MSAMGRTALLHWFLGMAFGAMLITTVWTIVTPDLPGCPEDAVLIGQGSYEQNRWSEYVCGPAVDDFVVDIPA